MVRGVHTRGQKASFSTRLLWLVSVLIFAPGVIAQQSNVPLITIYSEKDTGTDESTWVGCQGPDGVFYFGSDSLITFDGSKWRQFPTNGARAIHALDLGQEGKLWAGAIDDAGWYDQKPSGEWSYHSLMPHVPPEHLPLGTIWNVFAQPTGALFVTTEKILHWDGKKMKIWSMPGARRLTASKSGTDIYLHHAPTGLYIMEPDGPRLIIPAETLGDRMVMWVEKNPTGLTIAYSQQLYHYADNKLEPFAMEASEYMRNNRLQSVVRLPDGRLALGTSLGGLVWLNPDGSIDRILTEKNGLPSNGIHSLYLDREKNLWGTSGFYIVRLNIGSPSTFFNQLSGVPTQPITKIVRHQNKLLAATAEKISEADPLIANFSTSQFPFHSIYDIRPVDDGLLVSGSEGVQKISDGKIAPFLPLTSTAFAIFPSITSPGNFLISHVGGVSIVDPAGHSRLAVRDSPDAVNSIAEDSLGRLWLGTGTHGVMLAQIDDILPVEAVDAGQTFGLPEHAENARVRSTKDGTVLAFTTAGGWMLGRDSSKFIPIEHFPDWKVQGVSNEAPDGSVWIVHLNEKNRPPSVARILIQGNRAIWQPHSVDGLSNIGMGESIFAESGIDGSTVLWIGGTSGILRNVVTKGPQAPAPRPPILRSLYRDGQDSLQAITAALPYSTKGIVFEFAAPEFTNHQALRLETMLEGVDNDWGPATESTRELSALRDGTYTFKVRVMAETGVASPVTASRFVINPPWWRTGAAMLGGILALVPAAYGFYRWRVRLLRQRNTQLEQKVVERTLQLEKASAAKTQFVANMSHDIRNPLNGIVGLTVALEDTWLDVKQRELVATLRECTSYLSTLVDDVLDFATIEAGQVELRPAPFSPVELLRSIAVMFKMEAISSGAVFEVESDSRLPSMYVGDAGRIQQVLVNFVTNALKYSGGPIKLTVTIPETASEEIEFSVSDRGPGISEDGQRLLFAKFSRLTASHSKEITGSGLGLASCRLLAGLMSGSVGVQSSVGQGARFYLRLPLDIFPTPAADAPAMPMAMPSRPNCTVLLVEDTNYNAMAAAAVLAKFGLSCDRACDGAQAIKLFAEKRHNLVLLDRNLPDMDGTEVARRIRRLESTGPRAIILAVTAYCTTEDRALCLNAGMDAFLGKPLTPQKLRRVLSAAGRRHLAAASMHVSPEVASADVDVSLLEYISDGTNEGLSRQIELFLIALSEVEKDLLQAAKSSDFKLMGDAAHGVLSQARLVGSASLSSAATALQNAALAHERDAFSGLLNRVRREIESLTAVVRRHPGAERTK